MGIFQIYTQKKGRFFMKYMVLLCDGMADTPVESLNNKTPMEVAKKPNMDALAKTSIVGMCKTVGDGLKPGSDVANLSVMGYDARTCYSGRSPLEAANLGIELLDNQIAMRMNLVTLSDEENYAYKTMVDYCGGDISTAEADELVKALEQHFGTDKLKFYTGVQYRHCLVADDAPLGLDFTPPHDISGRVVGEYLSTSPNAEKLVAMMKESYELLKDHPLNLKRIENDIVTMKNYFDEYDTTVHFISQEELDRDHKGIPHGGFVIRTGKTGQNLEHNNVIEYSLKLDSNPEFTSCVIVAYARAAYRLNKEGFSGCKTVFDIPPAYLSIKSGEELRKEML